MNPLEVTVLHIKEIYCKEHKSSTKARLLFAEARDEYKASRYSYYTGRSLPRDWYLEHIHNKYGYTDETMQDVKALLKEVDKRIMAKNALKNPRF